jgi:hypothetical protein
MFVLRYLSHFLNPAELDHTNKAAGEMLISQATK